jgi:hypothetical protein
MKKESIQEWNNALRHLVTTIIHATKAKQGQQQSIHTPNTDELHFGLLGHFKTIFGN